MSSSNSSPKNTTSTSTEVTTKNLNVSGNQGITAVGGEGGSLAFNYTPTTVDASQTSVVNQTTDFGAIHDATGLATHALDIVSANGQHAEDSILNAAGQFAARLGDLQHDNQTQLGNVVNALNTSFVQNTTDASQRVINATQEAGQQAADLISKIIQAVALAVVGSVAVYAITRSKKAA